MGPRSIDRGIREVLAATEATLGLQWGRDQLIAEFPSDQESYSPHPGFNGAAIN